MARPEQSDDAVQGDLFSLDASAHTFQRLDGSGWPDPARFPGNRPSARTRDQVWPDLVTSERPLLVAGFAAIAQLVDLVDQWERAGASSDGDRTRQVRVLLGSEPFATTRHSFASPDDAFTEEVRRYWLDERGISIELSAALVRTIEVIDAGRLVARAIDGPHPLHAKLYLGDHAGTVGSSNFTRAGLASNIEVNARFDGSSEPRRDAELRRIGEQLWEAGHDWTAELRELLEALLRVVPWHEALAAACADLLEGSWAQRYLEDVHAADGTTLWPSQRAGIAQALWIIENVGSVLVADATGSGKTRMGAHLVRAIRDRLWSTGRVRRDLTVLVCPPAVEDIWRAEAMATGLSIDTVSHGLLSRRGTHGPRLEREVVHSAQVLAVDEAHNFLNRDANRTQQVRDSRADHVALFTATPINRGATDLLQLVGLLGADNFADETLEILRRLERRRGRGAQLAPDELHQLQREIQRFTVRRTKRVLNRLVDRDPEAYRHPDGTRICRFPNHVPRTYRTEETADDATAAGQVRSLVDDVVGITQLERHLLVPAALRREYSDERWLEMRLAACTGLARHHVLGAMRSSRAALVEHLAGTEAAARRFAIDRAFKPQPTGDVIGKLERLARDGPPQVDLGCEVPDWLTDDTAWTERCDQERRRYEAMLEATEALGDAREQGKADLLVRLAEDHGRVLAFDRHLVTLAVLHDLLATDGHEAIVATGSTTQARKQVERSFARGSATRTIALCSDAMNEGINLQGASAIAHLDLPTTLRVAEQRVGRVDRMDSTHDRIEVWWPDDGPAFATRANEIFAERAAESNALLGANVVLPRFLDDPGARAPVDVDEQIAELQDTDDPDWDGIRDALEPVRGLVWGRHRLVPVDVYDDVLGSGRRTLTHLSLVRSLTPFAFLAVAASQHGAPRWLLLRGDQLRPVTDLVDIATHLRDLLGSDPDTVAFDEGARRWLTGALHAATRAERTLLPRQMQRALDQMARTCTHWRVDAQRGGDERSAHQWALLADAAAGRAETSQPDPYALAERWLALVEPVLRAHRAEHRHARYVLLRDIDDRLRDAPFDVDVVAGACSGILAEPPLAERVRSCIIGLPAAPGTDGPRRPSFGPSGST